MDDDPPVEKHPGLPALEDSGLASEDYYFEGPYLVFTAAYHLKRGFCCGSGCRHCPYRESSGAAQSEPAPEG
jgi:Family of unknown function (DUF5522)